jgi:hypothetical protein
MKMIRTPSLTRLLLPFVVLLSTPFPALANPFLGSAARFTVLAGSAVTATASNVTGDVGAGSAVTCTDSTVTGDVSAGVVTQTNCTAGSVHQGDMGPAQAHQDVLRAYAALGLVPCTRTLTGTLAGVTLTPGVYCFDAAATVTGALTLNGPATGLWMFKIGDALTGTNFSVVMAGGGQACNVYWRTGSGATLTASHVQGSVLAGAAITVTGGALNGDALATSAVTLTNTVVAGCSGW